MKSKKTLSIVSTIIGIGGLALGFIADIIDGKMTEQTIKEQVDEAMEAYKADNKKKK